MTWKVFYKYIYNIIRYFLKAPVVSAERPAVVNVPCTNLRCCKLFGRGNTCQPKGQREPLHLW